MRFGTFVTTLALLSIGSVAFAQINPRGRTEIGIRGKLVAVEYGKPALRGRDMLSQAPPGFVWRLGADRATSLQTQAELDFSGVVVPPGAYSLFARRVDEDDWELVFNRDTGQWGTQHDPRKDIAAVPLAQDAVPYVEVLTIELSPAENEESQLTISWGEHRLRATFRAN